MIPLLKTDEINKNSNAVIDKGCQELEQEIKRIAPTGDKIDTTTLKRAILTLNSKVRRNGGLSAFEMNTARDQSTSDNLNLNDKQLRKRQLETRKQDSAEKSNKIKVGDTVMIRNRSDKHKANDSFIVTKKEGSRIDLQKIGRLLSEKPAQLMSKVYNTDEKHVRITHRPETLTEDHGNDNDEIRNYKEQQTFSTKNSYPAWSPIDQKFFKVDESDTDEDDDNQQPRTIYRDTTNQLIQFEHVENDLEWDNSPEQYAIWNTYNTESSQSTPRLHEDLEENTDTTSSHEEVFLQDPRTPPKNPKLRRQNAMRKKTEHDGASNDTESSQFGNGTSINKSTNITVNTRFAQMSESSIFASTTTSPTARNRCDR